MAPLPSEQEQRPNFLVYQITDTSLIKLLSLLEGQLPASLVTFRRIQQTLHLLQQEPNHSPVVIASFDPETSGELPEDFVLGFFHRDSAEGLPANIFTSVELPDRPFRGGRTLSAPRRETHTAALLKAVLAQMRTLSPARPSNTSKIDVVRFGCVDANNMPLMRSASLVVGDSPLHVRLLFQKDNIRLFPHDDELPEHLCWDLIRPHDYKEILRTNNLVRGVPAIESWRGIGVRELRATAEIDRAPLVGWGFLGLDVSIRTLYVVPRWRRNRLARKIVISLLTGGAKPPCAADSRDCNSYDTPEMDGLGHTYAAENNDASIGLMKSIGALESGLACWPEVDLLKVSNTLAG